MAAKPAVVVNQSKALSYLTSPTVKIEVGNDEIRQTFYVHVGLITARSPFFAKALKNYAATDAEDSEIGGAQIEALKWQEGDDGVVQLPEDSPDTFQNYLQLLYSQSLPIAEDAQKSDLDDSLVETSESKREEALERAASSGAVEEQRKLAELYIFCEKVQDIQGKHAIIAAILDSTVKVRCNGSKYYPIPSIISLVYAGTVSSDPMRAFLVDCHVRVGHSDWASGEFTQFPHEFLFDVMVGMYKERARPSNLAEPENAEFYQSKLLGLKQADSE